MIYGGDDQKGWIIERREERGTHRVRSELIIVSITAQRRSEAASPSLSPFPLYVCFPFVRV